jgi:ubiquinone biosynthesis protein
MSEQVGWLTRRLRDEAPDWVQTLPQLPRLAHRALSRAEEPGLQRRLDLLDARQRTQTRLLWLTLGALVVIGALELYRVVAS